MSEPRYFSAMAQEHLAEAKGKLLEASAPAGLKAAVAEAIESLAALGLIRDSGRRRGGKIVWVCSAPELGGNDAAVVDAEKQLASEIALYGGSVSSEAAFRARYAKPAL